ncbi:MAG: Gfo/Idh/MocA family oxidoreductase [Anaerolineae bacterium]|nr:Gfo/Idh/MocA family oxidoreductase [Anaerolineae bacterium]
MKPKIRALLVGCGGISRAWLRAIQNMPDVDMVGFVDLFQEAAQQRALEFGYDHAVVSTDLAAALDDTRPEVVFNCTIPEAHAETTIAALEHGCHVLCEKPLADSMENARRMIETARKAGRTFAVIQNRRYDPNIRRLCTFLESGAIGKITTVNCDFYLGAHFGGFRDRMQHVLLLDMAIHTFDAARLIAGADPASVYCHEWNPAGSWYDHDASAVAIFEMKDADENEIVYTYRGSWCSEGLNTTWECDWRIIGEKGSVTWDGAEHLKAQVVAETGGFQSKLEDVTVPDWPDPDMARGHAGVIEAFVRAVQTGTTPETICTDNVKSLAMVLGAIESAEIKERVRLEL